MTMIHDVTLFGVRNDIPFDATRVAPKHIISPIIVLAAMSGKLSNGR
jgi:hypothetical protein